jgi:hypothetical protein
MPRFKTASATKVGLAKAWVKEHKPGLDVTYHLLKAAMMADGIRIKGELPADQLPELTEEQQAALSAALASIGVS